MSSGSPAAGGVPGVGTVSISGQPDSTLSTVIAVGLLGGAVYGSESRYGAYVFRANPFDAIQPTSPAAPALDASRTVNEQDCSKPIENWGANLKCR